jgi:hypothetical protein
VGLTVCDRSVGGSEEWEDVWWMDLQCSSRVSAVQQCTCILILRCT